MNLTLLANSNEIEDPGIFQAGKVNVMITPPVGDEDYWLFKVMVSDKQSIVGFPKFMQVGIGFQQEEDWNTNLPSTSSADKIFNHISHNKGDDSIPDERCIEAIEMIRTAATAYKQETADATA
jgi:hypothetical protein